MDMKIRKVTQLLVAVGLCCMAFGNASAATVTWEISGSVYDVNPELASVFSVGDSLIATLQFETSTPDSETGVAYRGKYENAATMAATVSGYSGFTDQMYIWVINDFTSDGSDRFLTSSTAQSTATGDYPIGDYTFSGMNMVFKDDNGGMFTSIDLPTISPSSALFEDEFFYLNFVKSIAPNTFLGASVLANDLQLTLVQTPNPVPLPPAALLFGSAIAGLLVIRWKQRPLLPI